MLAKLKDLPCFLRHKGFSLNRKISLLGFLKLHLGLHCWKKALCDAKVKSINPKKLVVPKKAVSVQNVLKLVDHISKLKKTNGIGLAVSDIVIFHRNISRDHTSQMLWEISVRTGINFMFAMVCSRFTYQSPWCHELKKWDAFSSSNKQRENG